VTPVILLGHETNIKSFEKCGVGNAVDKTKDFFLM
jgi:hypothetical protein